MSSQGKVNGSILPKDMVLLREKIKKKMFVHVTVRDVV